MSDTITEPTDNTLGNIVQHAMYPPGTEGSRTWPEIGASLRETLTKADLRIIPAAPVQPDEVLAAIADELERQARRVERLATTHSAGLPHGWCVRCETWRAVAAGLCREAAKMRAQMRSRATREHDDAHEPARTETEPTRAQHDDARAADIGQDAQTHARTGES